MRLILTIISGSAFIFYGLLILVSNHMKLEFKRYQMERFRTLVGYLEFAGGAGLLIGLTYHPLMLISSLGLALLMLMGTITRIRVRDPLLETIPAFILMLINSYLFLSEII